MNPVAVRVAQAAQPAVPQVANLRVGHGGEFVSPGRLAVGETADKAVCATNQARFKGALRECCRLGILPMNLCHSRRFT